MGTGKNLSRSLDLGFMEARKLGTEGSGCLLVGFFFLGFFWGCPCFFNLLFDF